MLTQLVHNGIIIPPVKLPPQLVLTIRGERRELTPPQIEMALAWARKQGTPYVQDPVFVRNFMRDFGAALDCPNLTADQVDFEPAFEIVQMERLLKASLTPEERKAAAAQRKQEREQLKEQYGYALVDNERVELGNYMAEPSGIFMGRGKHPLRGKWKAGAQKCDITLNLSSADHLPDRAEWAEIIWQPESLWVARWEDKLTGKLKYIWLSDTAPVKQEREAAKFDKAVDLDRHIDQVRAHIEQALTDPNAKRRMVATACYLIDMLCLRVGDEKDPDEADTVGATTLRPEHVTLHPDSTAEFKFLGKDSVLWHKTIPLPPMVQQNLDDLIRHARPSGSGGNGKRHSAHAKPQIFPDIDSGDVNAFLAEVLPNLTAKVFRTHHATRVVRESLAAVDVEADDPDYQKWGAVVEANLEAAVLCNHYKKAPANWQTRRQRAADRRKQLEEKITAARAELRLATDALTALQREAREKKKAAPSDEQREKIAARYAKRIAQAQKKVELAQGKVQRAETAAGKAKTQDTVAARGRTWNLGTSLKSYIDPRVFYHWGQEMDYDVLRLYYPKTLQRKFAWVRTAENEDE